jgi:hypothetical protein
MVCIRCYELNGQFFRGGRIMVKMLLLENENIFIGTQDQDSGYIHNVYIFIKGIKCYF